MTKRIVSKFDGLWYGAIIGYALGLLACIICRANHILIDSLMPFKMILLYAVILAIPVAIVGYAFPRTMKWVAVILSLLPIP